MDINYTLNHPSEEPGEPSAAMQARLSTLGEAIGLPKASSFSKAFFQEVSKQLPERYEALLENLATLTSAFQNAPHRYCETLADELMHELRRACGQDATPEEIAAVVSPRAAVDQLARELLNRLAAVMRNRPDPERKNWQSIVGQLCRFLLYDDNCTD